MSSSPIHVRFAPSPTGLLHVGGARTALFNYYFAKRYKGHFHLRIEDTDRERSKEEFTQDILAGLKWLGLSWEPELVFQSKRDARYRQVVEGLLGGGHAYKCYCSTAEIEQMREDAQKKGLKPRYDRRCRDRKPDASDASKPFVVRFKTPLTGVLMVDDQIAGEVKFPLEEFDDFVLARSDGSPVYMLSVVVDDHDMKISHVIRGDDHLNNTPKQILLFQAMGAKAPVYAHLPMILGPDKAKLSKRHGAVSTTVYREEGILPEAMRSYMMKLGWGHGDQEIFSDEDLANVFSLEGCRQSAAVFDVVKLKWVNSQFLAKKSPEEIVGVVKELYGKDLSVYLKTETGRKLLLAIVERHPTLKEISDSAASLIASELSFDEKARADVVATSDKALLSDFRSQIAALKTWSEQDLHDLLQTFVQAKAVGFAKVGKPLRIFVSGTLKSPDLSLMLAGLGRELVLARLDKGLADLKT
jgi:glutamyl-tRNA synthetase